MREEEDTVLYVVVMFSSLSLDHKMATNTTSPQCLAVKYWNAALIILSDFFQ